MDQAYLDIMQCIIKEVISITKDIIIENHTEKYTAITLNFDRAKFVNEKLNDDFFYFRGKKFTHSPDTDLITFFVGFTLDDCRLFLQLLYFHTYDIGSRKDIIQKGINFFKDEIKNHKLIDVQNLVADIKSMQ